MSVLSRFASALTRRSSDYLKHTNRKDGDVRQSARRRKGLSECGPYVFPPIDGGLGQSALGGPHAAGPTGSAEPTSPSNTPVTQLDQNGERPYDCCRSCDRYFSSQADIYLHRFEAHQNEPPLFSPCPICSVLCSVPNHLIRIALHRCSQNSLMEHPSIAESDAVWPRACSECNVMLHSFQEEKGHYSIIRKHSHIMHEIQAESADEWNLFCWPCDRYFASEPELTQHLVVCTSRLKYLTRLEGELLAATSQGNMTLQNSPERDSGRIAPGLPPSPHDQGADIVPEEHHTRPDPSPSPSRIRLFNRPVLRSSSSAPVTPSARQRKEDGANPRKAVRTRSSHADAALQSLTSTYPTLLYASAWDHGSPGQRKDGDGGAESPTGMEEEPLPSYLDTILQDVPRPGPISGSSTPGLVQTTPAAGSSAYPNARPLPSS